MQDTTNSFSFQHITAESGLVTGRDTAWCQDDRKFFETHEKRSYRTQAVFPGELIGHPYGPLDRIVVYQMAPGGRLRFAFRVESARDSIAMMRELVAHAEGSENASRLLFDLASQYSGKLISPAELAALVQEYDAAPSSSGTQS
jgi:hypothetical protein